MQRHIFKFALGVFAALVFGAAGAQGPYPDRPVRIIVPFPAGGALDTVTRIVAQKLGIRFNQPFVVEPRAGAGGSIGATAVAKSPADGYTLVMGTVGTHGINSSLYKSLPYDPLKDFVAIAPVATAPNILVVHPSLGAKSVKDLIAAAKQQPGGLTFGSGGEGTTQHLASELLANMGSLQLTHVPYKGVPPAMLDLVSGRISLMFSNIPVAMPFIKEKQLTVLAIASAKRSVLWPDLPTVAEAGLPGYAVETWYGLFAPAGTPAPVVALLNTEINRILALPDVKESLIAQGTEPLSSTPSEFTALVKRDMDKWAGVIKASGIKAQ